jgi:hypothetical protein
LLLREGGPQRWGVGFKRQGDALVPLPARVGDCGAVIRIMHANGFSLRKIAAVFVPR